MDGFEATDKIRRMEANPALRMSHTPIIALTAHATAGYRDLCIAKGMDDYLSKPFNTQQIVEKLQRWVKTKQSPGPAANGTKTESEFQGLAAPEHGDHAGIVEMERVQRFNSERLDQMAMIKLPGKPNLRDGLLKLYFENAPELAIQIRNAALLADIDALHQCSHSLKSTSANMGLDHLSQLASRLEECSHAKRLQDIPQLVDALLCEHELALETLRDYQASCG